MKTRRVTADIHVLASEFPAPGLGVLPVNAYLLKAREPVLIDAGQPRDAEVTARDHLLGARDSKPGHRGRHGSRLLLESG